MKFELDEKLVRDFLDNSTNPPYDEVEALAEALRLQLTVDRVNWVGDTKVYMVGPDEINIDDHWEFDWIVYHYTQGTWDGSGVAAYKRGDKFGWANIGHCSCYGPEEQIGSAEMDILSLYRDLLTNHNDYDHGMMSPVLSKVVEIEFVDWETAKKDLGLTAKKELGL